jgi:hypothetical protein
MPNDREHQPLIGPDGYQSEPSMLMDDARERIHEEDAKNKDSVKLARRLFIAMILIAVLGVVFYAVLPYYGLRLSPIVPLLSFLAILAAAVLTGIEESRDSENPNAQNEPDGPCKNDGCATGMCPGPRPLQMFRDKKPPAND